MCCNRWCFLLLLVVVVVGLLFGFGVYTKGFHKLKDILHDEDLGPSRRPFITGFGAPPPF
ncbi:hypothetical protein QJS10_CPA05g02103 [Acorus calamus]|uniref:Transmembrane protein n=1 Tax=Acorus calamus TaxID=4465 RepID=A0AAV9EWI0_ACOCL|nr:hypothetical protein QJS10_CPA05g02103 [Acorus calamus]